MQTYALEEGPSLMIVWKLILLACMLVVYSSHLEKLLIAIVYHLSEVFIDKKHGNKHALSKGNPYVFTCFVLFLFNYFFISIVRIFGVKFRKK